MRSSAPAVPSFRPLPLVDDEVDRRGRHPPEEAEERRHFRRPQERTFRRSERGCTTIWFGGLTLRHEELIRAGLEGLGYRVGVLRTPEKADFQAGKEFGNNGQCNPAHFTVGALVNHLRRLRDDEGVPLQEILDRHVFLTAGACGPCRFGMYEAEYRLALRNSGFDGFRVLLFQERGWMARAAVEAGLEFDLPFFLMLLNAVLVGDLLNDLAFQIRPYEVVPGATDRALSACLERCQEVLRSPRPEGEDPGVAARLLARLPLGKDPVSARRALDELGSRPLVEVLERCRTALEGVEVDLLRPRPVVKVTGEFWAQTTEGDGNFRMFRFLESEGAEVLVEPIATWLAYMVHQSARRADDRRGLTPEGREARHPGEAARSWAAWVRRRAGFRIAEAALSRKHEAFRQALGGTAHPLVDQRELAHLAQPFYHARAAGGEGHLEVGKAIHCTLHDLCHMVLSLKPFGCMPSTQSDGVQAAVQAAFPRMIFLPVETSGEGDVNAHSRVQMALGEARRRCLDEVRQAVVDTGRSLEEIRAFASARAELRSPLTPVPALPGVAGRAARFVHEVARRMGMA